jgi:hypothetical protein
VYDMYPWRADGAHPARARRRAGRSPQSSARPASSRRPTGPAPAERAVQAALDRRDNGGDAGRLPGPPAAGQGRG